LTLHTWPARRPLAASRAALLATLLPDPGDPEKRRQLLDAIGGEVAVRSVEDEDEEGNTVVEEKEVLEGGVLALKRETDPSLGQLRDAIKEFYAGRSPRVVDPFAGGGAIPFEAMRLGCEVRASDLNPVAWVISQVHSGLSTAVLGQEVGTASVRAELAGVRRGFYLRQGQEAARQQEASL